MAGPPSSIAGLGNPGSVYERTRHNVGFMVVDELARRFGAAFRPGRGRVLMRCTGASEGRTVHLMKPVTYMNDSGAAVPEALERIQDSRPDALLVVLDDFQLSARDAAHAADGKRRRT